MATPRAIAMRQQATLDSIDARLARIEADLGIKSDEPAESPSLPVSPAAPVIPGPTVPVTPSTVTLNPSPVSVTVTADPAKVS